MCLQHRIIPPNLHMGELNALMDGASDLVADTASASATGCHGERRVIFPRCEPIALPTDERTNTAYASVSSFGSGGTNAHVVLQSGMSNAVRGMVWGWGTAAAV